MNKELKNILVIDIETVSEAKQFKELSPEMQNHWERKAGFLRNPDELSSDKLYLDKGAIYAEFGKVIVIAVGIYHETEQEGTGLRVTSFFNHDESILLKEFKKFIESKFDFKKLRLCAHNGKEFDYPYLCRRMLINGISIPKALDQSGRKPWEVPHLDTMEMWKFGDWKSFTSLDLLSTLFKIPSSKSDIDGSRVNDVYYNEKDGLDRIAKYCRGDVVATAQLLLKLRNLQIIDPSHITIVD